MVQIETRWSLDLGRILFTRLVCFKKCLRLARKPSHFAKFKALGLGATEQQRTLSRLLEDDGDFRIDFELSPILSATLAEYDPDDVERPSVEELLALAERLTSSHDPVHWESLKEKYITRSPLFLEVIAHCRSGYRNGESPSKIFRSLLEMTDSIQQWTPLLWAAYAGRQSSLTTLLKHGANAFYITPSGRNIFHHVCESGDTDILIYLLGKGYHRMGVDINLPDDWLETPLHLAAEKTAKMVQIYLDHSANISARQGDGLLPLAYPRVLRNPRRYETLSTLLASHSHGCHEINSIDTIGRTPIFYYLDTPNCVKLLLDHGADIGIVDTAGNTLIHHACITNNSESLSLLLDRATLELANARDADSNSPLFLSFKKQSTDCARILLRRTRILEVVDKKGWTVLHHAATLGDEICLGLALSILEIDIGARTPKGQTALDLINASQTSSRHMQEIIYKMSVPSS